MGKSPYHLGLGPHRYGLGVPHPQDATPLTLGHEFSGYAAQVELGLELEDYRFASREEFMAMKTSGELRYVERRDRSRTLLVALADLPIRARDVAVLPPCALGLELGLRLFLANP